jgi:hypothetical protein
MPRQPLTGSGGFNWFVHSGVRPHLPSKRILSGVGELRWRGGGGNLGVRRTLPVRSGLMGPVVAGF